jgi:hypothetical protein
MDETFRKSNRKECVRVKIRLLERGWTYKMLAARIKRDAKQVGNVLYGNTFSWPIRKAVNQALGEKIFSRPPSSRRRKRVRRPSPSSPLPHSTPPIEHPQCGTRKI